MTQPSLRLASATLALATSALFAQSVHSQPLASHQECLMVRNINGFNAPNDRTIYIRSGASDIWRVDLMNDCTGLSFRQDVRLHSLAGDPWICGPIQAEVSFRDTGIAERCPVTGLHKLTADEVTALPRRDRP